MIHRLDRLSAVYSSSFTGVQQTRHINVSSFQDEHEMLAVVWSCAACQEMINKVVNVTTTDTGSSPWQ